MILKFNGFNGQREGGEKERGRDGGEREREGERGGELYKYYFRNFDLI